MPCVTEKKTHGVALRIIAAGACFHFTEKRPISELIPTFVFFPVGLYGLPSLADIGTKYWPGPIPNRFFFFDGGRRLFALYRDPSMSVFREKDIVARR